MGMLLHPGSTSLDTFTFFSLFFFTFPSLCLPPLHPPGLSRAMEGNVTPERYQPHTCCSLSSLIPSLALFKALSKAGQTLFKFSERVRCVNALYSPPAIQGRFGETLFKCLQNVNYNLIDVFLIYISVIFSPPYFSFLGQKHRK